MARSPLGGRPCAAPADAPPTAVVTGDDLTAIGLIDALEARGVEVPGDLSVVGFDDIAFAGVRRIGLTTIRQPSGRIGELAAHVLIEQLEGRDRRPSIGARAARARARDPRTTAARPHAGGMTMRCGVFTDGLAHLSLEAAAAWCAERGFGDLELGVGGYSPAPHLALGRLLEEPAARDELLRTIAGARCASRRSTRRATRCIRIPLPPPGTMRRCGGRSGSPACSASSAWSR